MNHKLSIAQPELLNVTDGHTLFTGGSQEWYPDPWRRRSGCGPTTASGLVWYLARLRESYGALCSVGPADKQSFLALMVEMFSYVTPGRRGVNTSERFTTGLIRYGEVHGFSLQARTLEIPPRNRPGPDAFRDFISRCLSENCPVAFLNLSNGALKNLDNWHWVTLLSLEPKTLLATMCDQGLLWEIDIGLWLRTSAFGGALVALAVSD